MRHKSRTGDSSARVRWQTVPMTASHTESAAGSSQPCCALTVRLESFAMAFAAGAAWWWRYRRR
jgi:hypothetical protein